LSRFDAIDLRSASADLTAAVVPGAGMVVASLRHRGRELLGQRAGVRGYAERGATMGIPLLHPWANRLAADSFVFEGVEVRLPRSGGGVRREEHGLPIHGLLAGSPDWVVAPGDGRGGGTSIAAELDFGAQPELMAVFPFAHRIRLEVAVAGRTLRVRTTLTATGERPVPAAFGFHPYLRLPDAPRASWRVELPAMRHLELDPRGIPTGGGSAVPAQAGALGRRTFDDGYSDVAPGAEFVLAGGRRRITVRFEEGYRFAQVFAPPEDDVVCFEPMVAPTNALVSGDGLTVVPPGARYAAAFSVTVSAVTPEAVPGRGAGPARTA
jgi:galactose mutarotase-like enzyme